MPIFDVFLARTYRVRIEADDEAIAERLVEEAIADPNASAKGQSSADFAILQIETVDNHAFDAILVSE